MYKQNAPSQQRRPHRHQPHRASKRSLPSTVPALPSLNLQVRATHLSAYDPVYPVVVGIPPSQPKGYFRAFSEMISIPLEEPRLAQLLPHRFRRTIRLYGISPMVLLAKPKRRLEPLGMPLGFPRLPSLTSDKPLGSIPTNTDDGKRVAGAEIEPRLGDDGEFGPLNFDESDLTTNGTAADLESNADSALHPVLEDRTTMAMSPTQSAPEPSDTQAADVAPPDIADSNPSQIDAPPKREPARPQRRDSDRAVPKPQPPKVERVQRKSSKQFETAPKATKTRKQTIIDSPPPLPVDDSPPLEDTQRHPSPPEKLPPPQPEVHVTVVTPPQPLSRSISPPSKSTSHLSKDDRPAILQVKKPTAIPVVAHRRQPTQEEQKAEFEKQQNVLMAKKLERPNKAMQSGGNLINKSGSDATDQSKLQSIMAGEPLATSKGFLTSIMQNMRVMDEETKGRLTIISAPIFKEKPMVGMMEMENALKSMNASRKLSDQEIEYIKRVFELVNDDTVDKDEFLVIAALAERMTLLDQKVRLSFYDTDFKKLEKNIKEYRQLYTVYTADDGKMSYEDLNVLLQATGKSQEELGEISQMLNIKDVNPHSAVGFLDFLSYVPFFTKLHENIVNNPFGDTSSSLGDVAHALGTDTGLGGGGGRN
ncbi:hypothetical protein BC831DRAFT_39786 [Entophlyctis helioformis]|nr:hypothetical protein BC831DRAFT_39786 [Entophlyctis helioformis]